MLLLAEAEKRYETVIQEMYKALLYISNKRRHLGSTGASRLVSLVPGLFLLIVVVVAVVVVVVVVVVVLSCGVCVLVVGAVW